MPDQEAYIIKEDAKMKKHNWSVVNVVIGIFALALLAGCGTDTKTEYVQKSAPDSTYLVEYIPGMMPAAEGKTEFTLRIANRSDGSMVTGLTATGLSITPMMYMTDGSHSAPVDSITNNGDGTYTSHVYYLMPTAMGGMIKGHWELTVNIESESAVFYPYVNMAMSNNTAKTTLKGQSDIISSMTGTEQRTYYLFKDGVVTGATSTYSLFIAAKESTTKYPAVSDGTSLTSPSGAWLVSAATTTLMASTDLSTWLPGNDNGGGHWSIGGLSGLSSGNTGTVYVSFTVNGEQKTTNGLVSSGTNTYVTFTVTPQ